ncbi:NUDIX domain-containing protein (plasmid) [Nocardiopsis sp. LDBS0036]|uniref:NUDIX domain-containing protein n=1 Tax=Nocardiopsis sp. LDBS0036 TaxID=3104276 RepID=UPI0035157CFD
MSTQHTTTRTTLKRCCGTSVGGRLTRTSPVTGETEFAILGRGWWPPAWGLFAGHARDHGQPDFQAAAAAEGSEELGIRVTGLTELFTVHLPNLCASLPAQPVAGHLWTVYDVQTPTTTLTPAPGETTGAEWVTREELQRLADVTIRFAHSGRPAREQHRMSLEAVWVELLARTGDIVATDAARAAVARLYTTAPDTYWLGGRP